MTVRVAINGFGRIGRLVLRSALESGRKDITFVAINDLGTVEANAHLLEYDSVHGRAAFPIQTDTNSLIVNQHPIAVFSERNPEKLPWKELDIDVVLECTGIFTSKDQVQPHFAAGAKRVLVSAPCTEADRTVVYGLNHQDLTTEDRVISNASCTTNCLAPVIAAIESAGITIEQGYMNTVHAYTGDQNTVDTLHKDLRRARSANLSIIPTSTGAAKAVTLVLPHLKGKLDGNSFRVPTANVSIVDFTFTTDKPVSIEQVNTAFRQASQGTLAGILDTNEKPLVSLDFTHHPASAIADLTQTQVINNTLVRVAAWYDNEWGFSSRMSDTAVAIGRLLNK